MSKFEPGKFYYNSYIGGVYFAVNEEKALRWWPNDTFYDNGGETCNIYSSDDTELYKGDVTQYQLQVPEKYQHLLKRKDDSYWMIFREYGTAPTKKHADEKSAREEANRLALKNPGHKFLVMRVVAEYMTEQPKVEVKNLVQD